ncbi:MAG: GvpL/GvpF family gas vesicle protein [Armatimonadota bacterium]|nr:GvpL/GvpF family gas vesicle protein [Armatimonadota bacterium]
MTTPGVEPGEDEYGFYVYGIVGDVSIPPINGLRKEGIDPTNPVRALPYRSIQAILSRAPLREFGQEALEANLRDLRWLEEKVRVHEGIVEMVSAHCTLLPMKFGAIFLSKSRVEEMLAEHYDGFVDALRRLEGCREWGVKVYRNDEVLEDRIQEVSNSVRKLAAETAARSGGAAYIWKKRLEKSIASETALVSDQCAQSSHDCLSTHAKGAVSNPLLGRSITVDVGEMILNGVYLVSDDHLDAFQTELADLRKNYGRLGFTFSLSGPWPPYNFVNGFLTEGVVADE